MRDLTYSAWSGLNPDNAHKVVMSTMSLCIFVSSNATVPWMLMEATTEAKIAKCRRVPTSSPLCSTVSVISESKVRLAIRVSQSIHWCLQHAGITTGVACGCWSSRRWPVACRRAKVTMLWPWASHGQTYHKVTSTEKFSTGMRQL